MKKKVLQISNYYTPHIGGIESTCQYLSEGLSDDYEVRVICFSEDKCNKEELTNGIKVFKSGVNLNIARQGLSFSYYRILKNQMKWKPDIIHFHYPNPFVAALLLMLIPQDTKLYVHWHLDVTKQKKIYSFIKPFETRLLKRADMIAATSPIYKNDSKPLAPFLDKTTVLPSAIELCKFDLNDSDKELITKIKKEVGKRKVVLYVGRHVPHKGVGVLVDAEPQIDKEALIFIGGSGPYTEEVKSKCHSDRVKFLGRLTDQEMRCYYHVADVFAFPSYTKAEAFGLTLAEAMYCGAVPVTFNIPGSGVNWVSLNGVTGLEVANLDVDAYASAVNRLLTDEELRKTMAGNGRLRVVENFSVNKEIEILKEQYRSLCKK